MKSSVKRTAVAAALALSLAGAGCAADSPTTDVETNAASSGEVSALTLTAATTDGGQFDFGSLEGQDAVLWFWAPW